MDYFPTALGLGMIGLYALMIRAMLENRKKDRVEKVSGSQLIIVLSSSLGLWQS